MPRLSNPFSRPPSQDPREGQTYLPPGVKRAMNEYEQTAKPDNGPGGGIAPQVIAPSPGQPEPMQPGASAPPPGPALPSTQPAQPTQPSQPYDFITNPPTLPRQSLLSRLPSGGSLVVRLVLGVVAFIVLIILISVVKGITSQSGKTDAAVLLSVAQDQQEMLHIVNESITQASLSNSSRNFSATLQLSIGSSQVQIIQYLTNGGEKISPQALQPKISAATDNQLNDALTADNFDPAFRQVMQSQLNSYGQDLKKAYKQDTGPKARAILNDSYQQAQLLATQLNSPAS